MDHPEPADPFGSQFLLGSRKAKPRNSGGHVRSGSKDTGRMDMTLALPSVSSVKLGTIRMPCNIPVFFYKLYITSSNSSGVGRIPLNPPFSVKV